MKFGFGMENGFSALRKKAVEQRDKADQYERFEKKTLAKGGRPWKYYRVSMEDYFSPDTPGQGGGFETAFPGITEEVRSRIEHVHDLGHRALVVDLFGTADGASLGADKSIHLALARTGEDTEARTFIEGNALEAGTMIELIKHIRASGAELVLVTCIPGSGLPIKELMRSNDTFPYQTLQLIKLFERVLAELSSEGIFIIKLSNEGDAIGSKFATYLDTRNVNYEYDGEWPHVFKITKR